MTALEKIEMLGKAVAKMTQAELSRAVGCSRERIRQLVPRLKTKPGRKVRAWYRTIPTAFCRKMARLHDRGESLVSIGKRTGISDYHVREAIRRVNPNLQPAGRIQRLQRHESIRAMIARGLTFEQACDKLGFSGLQRRRYRRQMGFTWNGRKTIPAKRKAGAGK